MPRASTQKLVYDFLRRARRPVPVNEVIDYVLKVKSYSGPTPRNTISALIGKNPLIIKMDGMCLPIDPAEHSK